MPRRSTDATCTDIAYLERVLAKAEVAAFGGTEGKKHVPPERGIAGQQALRLCLEVRAQLELAQELAREGEGAGLSDAELIVKLIEEAKDMPDAHLEAIVRVYCDRHGLDFPHRVHRGGATA